MWNFDISSAPKDRPILAICKHVEEIEKRPDGSAIVSLYLAHGDGLAYAEDGPQILEWGGAFDDSTWEYSGANLPDWWFVRGSGFEVAANPICWMEIPGENSVSEIEQLKERIGTISGEAYQVIGIIADMAGIFNTPEVQKVLDYFSDEQTGNLLPWTPPSIKERPR